MTTEIIGQIVGLILAHSALIGSEQAEGELMVPYAIVQKDGSQEVVDFEASSQQEAVGLANKAIEKFQKTADAWAFAQEGLITLDSGEKQDVYFIKAWTKGMSEPLRLYQMFQPQPFKLLDNIKILNFDDTGLKMENANKFISALDTGIASHPTASEKWESWFD